MAKKKVEKKDIIGLLGLIVTILATILALTQNEVRCFLGLDDCNKKQETHQPVNPPDTIPPIIDSFPARPPAPEAKTTEIITYNGSVKDADGNLLPGITIVCHNCEKKETRTDQQGAFILQRRFDTGDESRQSLITLSKDHKTIESHINWRERSSQSITF